ncbi:hypothetical protein AX16_008994 [Volvariella volvacea WC 439]|nr:hypothetical protein AX16_008994 [Volvariella volvacea WC 439]
MSTILHSLAVSDIEQYLQLLHISPSTNNSVLPVQLLSTYATIPSRATEQAARLDLYAFFPTTIPPHSSSPINTHIAIAIPTGHYRRIAPRSGLAFKSGVTAFGGTIDTNYRRELKVLLRNDSDQEFKVRVGDCIAQLIIEPYAEVTPTQMTTLGSTVCGASGFGSTGLSLLSNPMPASSSTIQYLPADTRNSTLFSTYIKSNLKEFPAEMLTDSGATVSLVSEEFVKANGLKIIKTSTTTLLWNTNRSLNSHITYSLPLSLFLNGQFIPFSFYVTKIPIHTPFFLEHDFLIKFNPMINWQIEQISSVHIPPLSSLPDYEKGDQVIGVDLELWAVRHVTTESTSSPPSFEDTLTPIRTLDILEEYHEFFPVFEKEGFNQLP